MCYNPDKEWCFEKTNMDNFDFFLKADQKNKLFLVISASFISR